MIFEAYKSRLCIGKFIIIDSTSSLLMPRKDIESVLFNFIHESVVAKPNTKMQLIDLVKMHDTMSVSYVFQLCLAIFL